VQLEVGFLLQRPAFNLRAVHMGFVVGSGQVFLRVLGISPCQSCQSLHQCPIPITNPKTCDRPDQPAHYNKTGL